MPPRTGVIGVRFQLLGGRVGEWVSGAEEGASYHTDHFRTVDSLGLFSFERGEVKMKVIKIGIAPQEKIRERVLAIAKGEIKPKASDPKIWFTSMRSLSQVLSDENRALLDVIRTARPASISELADITGRKQGNLSRTLKTMSRYGLVKMEKNERSVRPIAYAESYQIMA